MLETPCILFSANNAGFVSFFHRKNAENILRKRRELFNKFQFYIYSAYLLYMKPLFTQNEYNLAKSRDKLLCECYVCNKPFKKIKYDIQKSLISNKEHKIKFCSNTCRIKKQSVNCTHCDIIFEKKLSEITKSKSGNNFCSLSCSASYNTKHKVTGNRRSKLEIYIEGQLTTLYPTLDIHFNRKDAINSELDIYIPSLNLAFELNGIFHYEPIYGANKLNQIQNNDVSKTKACHDAMIDLCIINTSQQKYFKEQSSKLYLNIITEIINLSNS